MAEQGKGRAPQRVLIVSYCFAPQNIIGAVRPTKIAKYLSRRGHQVTVLCGPGLGGIADPTLRRDLKELSDVHVVQEWNPLRDFKERKSPKAAAAQAAPGSQTLPRGRAPASLQKLRNALYLLLSRLADRSFARRGWRALKAMNRSFDVVISSYGPHSAHQIAAKAKARGMAKRWIADFRDAVEYPFAWQKGAAERYVRRVKEQADEITGATEGLLATMGLLSQAAVITNGFDPEDRPAALPPSDTQGCLSFAYCGQMYGSQRDLRPVFRTLFELVQEGELEKGRLRLDFAGKPLDWDAFARQAEQCALGERAQNHGMLPRDQALRLQQAASGILIAAWNTPSFQGNLPGKMLEALLLERPILCCVTGEVPGSEASRFMAQTQVGYCWAEAEGEAGSAGLKAYLQRLCRAFMAGEPIPFAPDRQAVETYAYPQLAGRFEALITTPEGER